MKTDAADGAKEMECPHTRSRRRYIHKSQPLKASNFIEQSGSLLLPECLPGYDIHHDLSNE
jgi:hypothetical protein